MSALNLLISLLNITSIHSLSHSSLSIIVLLSPHYHLSLHPLYPLTIFTSPSFPLLPLFTTSSTPPSPLHPHLPLITSSTPPSYIHSSLTRPSSPKHTTTTQPFTCSCSPSGPGASSRSHPLVPSPTLG